MTTKPFANAQNCSILVSVFEDRLEAERAVDDLEQSGFKKTEVGFALRGSDAVSGGMITDAVGAKDGQGAVKGAVAGAITGGILAAAAALIIPGLGPIIAGGILATALGGAAAGAATGGILGAMAGLGVSEEEARFYEKEFQNGKAIVTVRVDGDATAGDRAARILQRHGGYDFQCGRAVVDPMIRDSHSTSYNSSSERLG